MNIYAKYGDRVVFINPTNGYPTDQEDAKKYLVVGQEYTVNFTVVASCSTRVHLVGIKNDFNSVLFEDAKDKSNTFRAGHKV